MCRVYLLQASMAKIKSKNWKNAIILVFEKSYSTSCKGIGGHKKKEKFCKSKTRTLAFLYNLKKKQQYQVGKNWCCTESFMLLTISNLRTTAFYFGWKY